MNGLFEISSDHKMRELQEWLYEEDYDTEAVQADVENVSIDNLIDTNIGCQLQDKLLYDVLYEQISNFIHNAKC